MKNKSWQRYSLALLLIVGYFLVLILAMLTEKLEIVTKLIEALPIMFTGVVTTYIMQAGNEKQKSKEGPDVA